MSRKIFCFLICTTTMLLIAFSVPGEAKDKKIRDASWQKTFAAYSDVPCLTEEELEYGSEVIAGLGYNSSRAFRRMTRMQGMDFDRSKEAWSLLLTLGLSYEQVLTFEDWSRQGHIHIDLALSALPAIGSLGYEAGKSFRNYCSLPGISPELALKTIPLLNRLSDAQNRAYQQLLTLEDINAERALDGLGEIAKLNFYQALAVEAFAKIPAMSTQKVSDTFPLVRMLSMENAWNAKTLFTDSTMKQDPAWFWLVAFFANPTETQEKQFNNFTGEEKQTLLRAFYTGGEELIWKINNLHGITDRFGLEISNHALQKYSPEMIRERFEDLSPQVRSEFSGRFYGAGGRNTMIATLKQAVAAERSATARRLTSANIYALLSQGSELYDSSFRDILVPVLKKRITEGFGDDLLSFVQKIDPGNLLVSSFIVSLAQKGKLTAFFPADSAKQEKILDLVAGSAFKDEDAIILFSATFMHLLDVLEPSARSFLVARMSQQADAGTAAYARLITVILQYYLEEFPDLLRNEDREAIVRLIVRHGAVKLIDYLATPFSEWKEDGLLSSLSIFHPDDDGRDSFLSNARLLLGSGYSLSLSEQFTTTPMTDQVKKKLQQQIRAAGASPGSELPRLFRDMQNRHFAVDFTKNINGLTIRHAAHVYSDEHNQQLLMERYILSRTEMLAQRGHSYWRSEQITEPLETLLQQGRLKDMDLQAKQRFLSLGSCGGVKAYTRLNEMFLGRVDILATIGSGLAMINDPYNKNFFEVIARKPSTITWKDLSQDLAFIFQGSRGRDYLQPGSLPAILHKILDEEKNRTKGGSAGQQVLGSLNGPNG